jgi:hypothetical protein
MRKRLVVGLALATVAAALAAGLRALAPLVTDPGLPQITLVWPPNGLVIPAIAPPPPPPPPFTCPCLYDFDEAAEDEDAGPVEVVPLVRLADASGGRGPAAKDLVAPAQVSSLPQAETDRLLASLPPLLRDTGPSISSPAVEGGQLPPPTAERASPLTGGEAAPPPPVATAAPLTILRASPRGDVIVAPQLAALFSEPMAPVGQETPKIPPVLLTPSVPGEWRWLGSRLLVFSPATRFPMATDFVARIPDGERALSGSVLEHAFEWRFRHRHPQSSSAIPRLAPLAVTSSSSWPSTRRSCRDPCSRRFT